MKLCLSETDMPDLPIKDNSSTLLGYSKGAYLMDHNIQTKPYGQYGTRYLDRNCTIATDGRSYECMRMRMSNNVSKS